MPLFNAPFAFTPHPVFSFKDGHRPESNSFLSFDSNCAHHLNYFSLYL